VGSSVKVLIVQDYATLNGGAELETFTLRAGLVRRGIDARLFASWAATGGESAGADYQCYGTVGRFRTLVQSINPRAALALRRVLDSFRPDVVHVQIFLTQLGPLVLPLLRSVPAVHHVVWYRPICPKGTKLLPDGRLCGERYGRPCLRHGCLTLAEWVPLMAQLQLYGRWRGAFDAIVTDSKWVRERLLSEGFGPVEVIAPGVAERELRPPLGEPPVIAFAGRLVWEKGVDVLLHAFARVRRQVPGARLLIAGDGPERSALEGLAIELGVNQATSFLGYVHRAELERRFEDAWVQVLPGRWQEPFGLAAAEAMMRGTPVVASAGGGPSELVVPDRTGILVPPGDVEALTAALLHIATDRERAERMGLAGRAFALEHLGAERHVDDWLGLYERLVDRR
jgi:glycosyltransferase involved in cell wall biosynthesis